MNATQPIPQIIHQTWKSRQIPERWRALQQTWITHHPTWTYRLWTDEDNRNLISQHYPWFLPTYDAYDQNIKRADAARLFILHHCGGLYVDLDFECLRPVDAPLQGQAIVCGLEPPAHLEPTGVQQRGFHQILGNAFLASVPQHPFWEHSFSALLQARHLLAVLDATGPFLLTQAYNTYPHPQQIAILPAKLLYPANRDQTWDDHLSTDEIRTQAYAQNAYAIHYWHSSWRREAVFQTVRKRLSAS